jgi:class 3 adenylate cyclase
MKACRRLETAFGLNAGEVVVGNIGSQTRTKYGIVGGPVNLTSRIQAQAEGGEILVSQSVRDLLAEDLVVPRSFKCQAQGPGGRGCAVSGRRLSRLQRTKVIPGQPDKQSGLNRLISEEMFCIMKLPS